MAPVQDHEAIKLALKVHFNLILNVFCISVQEVKSAVVTVTPTQHLKR